MAFVWHQPLNQTPSEFAENHGYKFFCRPSVCFISTTFYTAFNTSHFLHLSITSTLNSYRQHAKKHSFQDHVETISYITWQEDQRHARIVGDTPTHANGLSSSLSRGCGENTERQGACGGGKRARGCCQDKGGAATREKIAKGI
jgi:hypothetical protein